jgi:hypothetical protein
MVFFKEMPLKLKKLISSNRIQTKKKSGKQSGRDAVPSPETQNSPLPPSHLEIALSLLTPHSKFPQSGCEKSLTIGDKWCHQDNELHLGWNAFHFTGKVIC